MSEPLAASLERLRNARLEPEGDAPELVNSSLPAQSLASRRLRRLEQGSAVMPDAEPPGRKCGIEAGERPDESGQNLGWSAAAQGRIASLDDDARGKPRLALGARAALAGIFALLALGGGIMSAHLLTAQGKPITIAASKGGGEIPSEALGLEVSSSEPGDLFEPQKIDANVGTVIVHVAGAVNQPGIVELPAGSRVAQAVEKAGGAGESAELTAINLARVLVDGEQIVIPVAGQELPQQTVTAEPPPPPPVDLSRVRDESGRVNLNQASTELLQELTGIGPALAGRIIDYRESIGGFRSVDQLQEVSGIGPAVMSKVRDQVSV